MEAENLEQVDPEFHRLMAWWCENRKKVAEASEVEKISVGAYKSAHCLLVIDNEGHPHGFQNMKQFKLWRKIRPKVAPRRPAVSKREIKPDPSEPEETKMSPEVAQILAMAASFMHGRRK